MQLVAKGERKTKKKKKKKKDNFNSKCGDKGMNEK